MKSLIKLIRCLYTVLLINVLFLFSSTFAFSAKVERKKDDITIVVNSVKKDSGKTLIISNIYNNSNHVIATVNLKTRSSAFYFKLVDSSGKEIMQNAEWANDYAQKGSRRYLHPRSYRWDFIYPNENIEFQFYLEDAYGPEISKGFEMIISWESRYRDRMIDVSEYVDRNGDKIEAGSKPYMFPEYWDITATLPLQGTSSSDEQVEVPDHESIVDPTAAHEPKPKDPAKLAHPEPIVKQDPPAPQNRFWWVVGILLVLVLCGVAARFLHRGK